MVRLAAARSNRRLGAYEHCMEVAVLGAILFQRVLGNFKPRSVEVCGVTFVGVLS